MILSSADHLISCIPQLIDVFSQKANLNLVLEFLEYDLEMVIKNKSIVFSSGDVKSWVSMALKGLRHCHALYILHRVGLLHWAECLIRKYLLIQMQQTRT